MPSLVQAFIIFLHSLAAFGGLFAFFVIAKDWPRTLFTVVHWIVVAVVFGLVFSVYYRFFKDTSAFTTMVIAMVSIFIIEFIVYSFVYKGELWFLNWFDYTVSVFIAATVVYWIKLIVH